MRNAVFSILPPRGLQHVSNDVEVCVRRRWVEALARRLNPFSPSSPGVLSTCWASFVATATLLASERIVVALASRLPCFCPLRRNLETLVFCSGDQLASTVRMFESRLVSQPFWDHVLSDQCVGNLAFAATARCGPLPLKEVSDHDLDPAHCLFEADDALRFAVAFLGEGLDLARLLFSVSCEFEPTLVVGGASCTRRHRAASRKGARVVGKAQQSN